MSDELLNKIEEYASVFEAGFPMMPIGWGRSEKEVIKIIDDCLEKGKDAYALGYLDDDLYIEY